MLFKPTENIGENIRALRTAKGESQELLASRLNVTAQAVSRWESGRTTPDISMLPSIAGYFGVTIDSLMGFDPSEKARNAAKLELSRMTANEAPERVVEACLSALRLYPNDLDIALLSATALFSRASELELKRESTQIPDDGGEKQLCAESREMSDKGIELCLRVINEYPNASHAEIIRGSARMLLMRFYSLRGELAAAKETAQLMPILSATRDFNLLGLLDKTELTQQLGATLTQLGGLLIQLMNAGVYERGERHGLMKLTADECRRLTQALEGLYALTEFADCRADLVYLLLNVVWARRLCELGEPETARKRLEIAVDCLEYAKNGSIIRQLPSVDGMIGIEPGDDRLTAVELIEVYFERGYFSEIEKLGGYRELRERLSRMTEKA